MARNKNVYSAEFSNTNIAQPRNYRISLEYQTLEDSAGPDTAISSSDPVRGRGSVQLAIADYDSAVAMLALIGTEATLVLKTQDQNTSAVRTITIGNARLIGVVMDAVHADVSAHILTFVYRTTDGSSFTILHG